MARSTLLVPVVLSVLVAACGGDDDSGGGGAAGSGTSGSGGSSAGAAGASAGAGGSSAGAGGSTAGASGSTSGAGGSTSGAGGSSAGAGGSSAGAGGSTAGAAGASAGAGGSSAGAGGSSAGAAGACAGGSTGSAGGCNALVNDGTEVVGTSDPGATPTGTGGTIADGKYHLTGFVAYAGSPVKAFKETQTLEISCGGKVGQLVNKRMDGEFHKTFQIAASGTAPNLTTSCSLDPMEFDLKYSSYTATPTTLTLYSATYAFSATFSK